MFPTTSTFVYHILVVCLLPEAVVCLTEEASYVKVRVPQGYVKARDGEEEKAFGTRSDCAFGCTLVGEAECTAFLFQQGECTLATIDAASSKFVPSYVREGVDIMVRQEKISLGARIVPHIGFIGNDAGVEYDDALDHPGFGPIDMPRQSEVQDDKKIFGTEMYKNGLFVCGNYVNNAIIKKCWQWTFHSGKWMEVPGDLMYGHFYGGVVVAGGKLWVFSGRPAPSTNPTRKVESFDLKLKVWKEEDDVAFSPGTSFFTAITFDDTKVLLTSAC